MNERRKFILYMTGSILPITTYAQNNQVISMVYADGLAPYSYFDKVEGKPRGILIDLVDMIFSEAGLTCSHQTFPWKRAQRMIKNGEADGLCAPATIDRQQYIHFYSEHPITTLRNQLIFVKTDHPKLKNMQQASNLKDLYNFKTATFLGNSTDSITWKNHPDIKYMDNIDQILVLLANDRIDFYAADPIVTLYKIRQIQKSKPELKFSYFHKQFIQPQGQQVTMTLGLRKTLPGAKDTLSQLGNVIKNHINSDFEQKVVQQYIGEFFRKKG